VPAELSSPPSALEGWREAPDPQARSIPGAREVESPSDPRRSSERSQESEPRSPDTQPRQPTAGAAQAHAAGDEHAGSSQGAESGAATGAEGASTATGGAASAPSSSDPPHGAGAPQLGGEERGTLAGRWWPRRHDAVVAGWVEARRASAAGER